jgi:lysozyme family protein
MAHSGKESAVHFAEAIQCFELSAGKELEWAVADFGIMNVTRKAVESLQKALERASATGAD